MGRSTCPSQNVQSTAFSDHLWKLRCRKNTFPSQNVQSTPHVRTTFGSSAVGKVHAVVARSTFPSQNAHSTPHVHGELLRYPLPLIPPRKIFSYSAIVEGCSVKIFCYVADVWNNFPAILLPWYGMVWSYGRTNYSMVW